MRVIIVDFALVTPVEKYEAIIPQLPRVSCTEKWKRKKYRTANLKNILYNIISPKILLHC